MVDPAASVLAKLKNVSRQTGRDFRLCLQLFCQEEFLRRLAASRYANNFVLKGGLFLYALSNFSGRVTIDIDFLLRRIRNSPEALRRVVEEIIGTDVGNGFISFDVVDVSPIAVAKKYKGVGVRLVARIKNTRTPINIDLGVGDVIVPEAVRRTIPAQLSEYPAPTLKTYSLETTVAEKIDAILALMNFSSRMKDFYDIYYLSRHYPFDGKTLAQALRSTFENRGRDFTVSQMEDLAAFSQDDTMVARWTAFAKRVEIDEVDFAKVLVQINTFLDLPVKAVLEGGSFCASWSPEDNGWRD